MESNVLQGLLCDFYGEFLTPRQRRAMQLRYDEDLSLGEIAETLGITRQGVHDTLRRAQATLQACEQRLGLAARYMRLRELLAQAQALAAPQGGEMAALLEEMTKVWEGADGL